MIRRQKRGSADGFLYSLRIADGSRVWSYDLRGEVVASPAVAGGKVFVGSGGGTVFAFGAKE